MSSRERPSFVLLVLAATLLAGCGFHPLNARQDGSASTVRELADIKIATIADRSGQLLHNALLERLTPAGGSSKPKYLLTVSLSDSKQEIGILKDETSSRANYNAFATFTLADKAGAALYRSAASSQVSYNILGEHYASTVAETNARDRAMGELAESISRQLSAFFARRHESAMTPK